MFMTEWTVGAGAGFAHARALREAVRVYEQGISSEQEFDAMDAVAAHLFVCTDAGEPLLPGGCTPAWSMTLCGLTGLLLHPRSVGSSTTTFCCA